MIKITPINLIKKNQTQKVFGEIDSISKNEFFEAGQIDLKPQFKITIWTFEYDNQNIVEIDNKKYSIYRTYKRMDNKTELYVTEKVGTR